MTVWAALALFVCVVFGVVIGWFLGRWFERRRFVAALDTLKLWAHMLNIEVRPGESAKELRERLAEFWILPPSARRRRVRL